MAKHAEFPDLYEADEQTLNKQFAKLFGRADEQEQVSAIVAAAFKTVDTFSGLTGKRLWLKNSQEGAYTDGWEIGAPFKNSHFYQMVEHEISHILFKSNFKAKEQFSSEYAAQIQKAVESQGKQLAPETLKGLRNTLGMLINILEDHRVNSLWALLYPGSYTILQEYSQSILSKKDSLARAHTNLLTYFLLVAYNVPNIPAGQLDRLRPAFVAALKRVERKGPASTLVICKWLVTQVVSELIRALQNAPPPPDAGTAQIKVDIQLQKSLKSDSGDAEDSGSDAEGDGDSSDDSSMDDGEWEPPPVSATPQERIGALSRLIELSQSGDGAPSKGEERITKMLEDVRTSRNPADEKREADAMVKAALETDVNRKDATDLLLARSEQHMQGIVESVEMQLRKQRQLTEDEWIARDAHAKVIFKDVTDYKKPPPLNGEDARTARLLKERFNRVHQRMTKRLTDAGTEVDVEAYIRSLASDSPDPVFKEDVPGRGFKTLILVDRSSSMSGLPSMQVERATRILKNALKQPNIAVHVWGFQSNGPEVRITRIDSKTDIQTCEAMPVRGETPLHIAVRTAVNWLSDGTEKKQLIVLTDGVPVFSTSSGRSYGEKQLVDMVGKECNRARKQGINVTAVGIGHGVTDEAMKKMFGERKYWTQVSAGGLNKHLLSVIGSSFLNYFKHG